ncbi:hypothetical protein D3C76_855800 [compost metagenome]
MRLFRLEADKRMTYRAEPKGLTESERIRIVAETLQQAGRQQEPIQLPIREGMNLEYADYLESPLPLVSNRMRKFLEKAMPDLVWRAVILADMKSMHQEVYWLLSPPKLTCLSSKTAFHMDGALKHLVLDQQKVTRPLFQVEGMRERYVFVNLMLAESLLRRDYVGITLHAVELEGEGGVDQ